MSLTDQDKNQIHEDAKSLSDLFIQTAQLARLPVGTAVYAALMTAFRLMKVTGIPLDSATEIIKGFDTPTQETDTEFLDMLKDAKSWDKK